ncbi:hypothetical protein BJL57_08895 [Campylobacter jejuni]|nr:hypothetical protein [Campylobacter jejuni]
MYVTNEDGEEFEVEYVTNEDGEEFKFDFLNDLYNIEYKKKYFESFPKHKKLIDFIKANY